MIKLQNMTPKVYYNQSRDFQFIGRLYDIALNAVKTNTELINNLPLNEDMDNRLLDLLTMTLGFKSLHNYNINQLVALCKAFVEIIRGKGTITALEKACNVLVNAEGITSEVVIDEVDYKNNSIIIYIPSDIKDTNLLKDLLNYILPAGMTYDIIKTQISSQYAATKISAVDSVEAWVEHADRNAIVITDVIDSSNVDINKISNIPGVTLNDVVVSKSTICDIGLAINGTGTAKFYNMPGSTTATWCSIGAPIQIQTNKAISSINYSITKDASSAWIYSLANYTKIDNTHYIVNITKSTGFPFGTVPAEASIQVVF